jgi:cell pole-organizing protein PopZ
MEELLASIRKAIHDDIGEVPSSMSARSTGTLQRGATREFHVRAGEDTASAATEIQQLREKINRSRTAETQSPRDPPTRHDSIAAALQAEPPRRSWRDLEMQPRLRPSIVDPEPVAPPRAEAFQPRREPVPESPSFQPQTWHDEPPALPPPSRDSFRPRPEQPSILSNDASQAVNAAFSRLAENMLARTTSERSLEDMVREMLRVMLKQWLDENLPTLVEKLVREEIERVARTGR